MEKMADLIARAAQAGEVRWLGLRPERRAAMQVVQNAMILEDGLDGDRAGVGKRSVTLIQQEHLPVIAACLGREPIAPEVLRRNIVVSGLNLLSLRSQRIRIGRAVLRITGPCAPCSRMEQALGHGGYAALRGHGGMTAEVIAPGRVAVGDAVVPIDMALPDAG